MIASAGAQTSSPDKSSPRSAPLQKPVKVDERIADRLKKIVTEQLGVLPAQVIPKARYVQDLGADSLDFVEIIMAIEDEFKIAIPDEDAIKLLTVELTVKYLETKLQKATNDTGKKVN